MLRQTVRVFLPHGVLVQHAAGSGSLQLCGLLSQTRNRSSAASNDSDSQNSLAYGSGNASPADGLDLPAGELLSHADSIISASDAAEAAVLMAVRAESWPVTRTVLSVMTWAHEYMPWFEAIAISNVVLKACTLPLTVFSQKQAPRMQEIREQTERMKQLSQQVSQARTASEYERLSREHRDMMREFQQRNKGTLLAGLAVPGLAVLQAVIFISHFSVVGNLCKAKLPSMTHEGSLWFTDLTLPDPYYGLPIIAAASTLAMLSSGSMGDTLRQMGEKAGMMRNLATIFAIAMIPAGHFAPSGIALLWGSNAVLSVAQNYLLGSPGVRKTLGLPPIKSAASSSAGSSLAAKFMDRFKGFKRARSAAMVESAGLTAENSSSVLGAPPPGARSAVNYLTNKPRRKR